MTVNDVLRSQWSSWIICIDGLSFFHMFRFKFVQQISEHGKFYLIHYK